MQLYKYMSHEGFLSNFMLRFTLPSELNDPRECVPEIHIKDPRGYISNVIQRNFERGYLRLLIENPTMSPEEALKRCIHASEQIEQDFNSNNEVWIKRIFDNFMKVTNRNIAILSLSESPTNELMWAHYANSHQGYVIGFDSENDFFKPRKGDPKTCGELMSVQYSDTRPQVFVDPGKLDIPKELFFTKTSTWSYEREWRIIRMQSSADSIVSGNIHLFKVPEAAVTSVIFGYKFPEVKRKAIEASIRVMTPHITFQFASFNHKGEFCVSQHI